VQRFRGGLIFKAHRLGVSLNSRRESNKEEEGRRLGIRGHGSRIAHTCSMLSCFKHGASASGLRFWGVWFRVQGPGSRLWD